MADHLHRDALSDNMIGDTLVNVGFHCLLLPLGLRMQPGWREGDHPPGGQRSRLGGCVAAKDGKPGRSASRPVLDGLGRHAPLLNSEIRRPEVLKWPASVSGFWVLGSGFRILASGLLTSDF